MTKQKLNIVIPMAGYGKRLRPHTWSKPKGLVGVAGKPVLGHVLDIVAATADLEQSELAFVIGYHGDQVRAYMRQHYPKVSAHFYVQEEMKGQAHAIALARQQLTGPTLIMFVDTIVDDDMSFLFKGDPAEAVIWVKQVEDPRRFGVVELSDDGYVKTLIEKPDTVENDLAVVGYYYFARGQDLMKAIDRQLHEDLRTKGEYFIADAIRLMMEDGLKLKTKVVDAWLDAGLPESVLETNRYLLDHGRDNTTGLEDKSGVVIHPPVYIDPSAEISNSTIGPQVSIGPGCQVVDSTIANSILEERAQVTGARLTASLLGARAQVHGVEGMFNIGDDAVVKDK